jgi:hypothetical protein
LRGAQRHHTVNAHAGQDEGEPGKRAEQTHCQAPRGEAPSNIFFHGVGGAERLVRIERLHFAFDGRDERERIAGFHSHDQSISRGGVLRRTKIDLVEVEALDVVFARGFIPRPRHDADDGGGRRVFDEGLIVVDVPSDRVLPREVFLGQRFIDDD